MNDIEKAIGLLRSSDYIVIKVTEQMKKDCKECEALEEKGEQVDCLGCACIRCVVQ